MPSSNAAKLGARDGDVVRVVGLDVAEASALLHDDALTLEVIARGRADVVVRFFAGLADVTRASSTLTREATTVARLWVAYPKGASRRSSSAGLHRDTLRQWLDEHDLRIATLISLSETWTAARVRPA